MIEYIIQDNFSTNYPRDQKSFSSDKLERFLDKVKRALTFIFLVMIATFTLYASLNFIYYQQGLHELAIEAQIEAEQGKVSGLTVEQPPSQTLYSPYY